MGPIEEEEEQEQEEEKMVSITTWSEVTDTTNNLKPGIRSMALTAPN